MANFEVKIVKIDDVMDHPNADRLSIVKIAGYSVVSGKLEDGSHRYKAGDLVAYVPENALVPEYLLKRGYWDEAKGVGFLSGPLGNRVKPVKLRGIVSEGIMFPVEELPGNEEFEGEMCWFKREDGTYLFVEEGHEVSSILSITKWEPTVPENMAGDLIGFAETMKYDIENIKKYNKVMIPGEMVYMTEKLHGTFAEFGWMRDGKYPELFEEEFFVASKGLGAKNLIFKDTPENRAGNLYVRQLVANIEKFKKMSDFFAGSKKVVFFGEIFGKGVQDLNYNVQAPQLRIFDIWSNDGGFLNFNDLERICDHADLPVVPVLYVGPYSDEVLIRETTGTTSINGAHIREGLVVKPLIERTDPYIDRVILKSVSDAYLSRKNGTEFN